MNMLFDVLGKPVLTTLWPFNGYATSMFATIRLPQF